MDDIDLHTHSTCSDGILTPRQVVGLAKSTGLRAVALTDHDTVAGVGEALAALAHPSTLALDQPGDLSALVARLKAMGLEGMEVLSPYHTREMTRVYEEVARRHGLLCTGGSDFHGGLSDHRDLGGARLGLRFPYALLDGLKMRIVERERRSGRGIGP